MTTKIEEVARAIADKAGAGWHYDACFDMARAAIEAMREPTPGMRRAIAVALHRHEWKGARNEFEAHESEYWLKSADAAADAMIDAALNEGKE